MNTQAVFHFKKILVNLDHCMTKAAAFSDAKKFDLDVLATYRLAPDMFAFNKQIQSACDSAKFCAAYLSGQTAPKHEDNESTWTELRDRIRKVVDYLESFKENDFKNADTIQVKPGWAQGKWLSADDYLNQIAIPNFYFHVMTAYAIMRHAGVEIGKMDYLGQIELRS